METEKIFCDGCSRGCRVEVEKEGGRYYISGNNCSRGEQSVRDSIPHLKEAVLLPKGSRKKAGFLGMLFGRNIDK
jgi:CxxC motif-containing protein